MSRSIAPEHELLDNFERVDDDFLAGDRVGDDRGGAGAFDGDGHHVLVAFAVARQTARHDLVALGERMFQ